MSGLRLNAAVHPVASSGGLSLTKCSAPLPTAKTAGQDFIAAAVVPQTLIMQQAQSQVFTNTAVSFSEKEWNVPL